MVRFRRRVTNPGKNIAFWPGFQGKRFILVVDAPRCATLGEPLAIARGTRGLALQNLSEFQTSTNRAVLIFDISYFIYDSTSFDKKAHLVCVPEAATRREAA